jgi:tRNA splicing endonuclease
MCVYSKSEDIQHYEFCVSAKSELKTAQQRVNVTLYFVTEQC